MRSRPSAFSLIELLVVVTVMSVLAALLAPALTSAKEKARGIGCASNLRQMGLAVHVYAADHDGGFPAIRYPLLYDFSYLLNPTLGPSARCWESHPWLPSDLVLAREERSRIFECPSRTIKTPYVDLSYAAHPRLMYDYVAGYTGGTFPGLKIADVPRPSGIILMADATQTADGNTAQTLRAVQAYGGYPAGDFAMHTDGDPARAEDAIKPGSDSDSAALESEIRYRHHGRANFVFVDGHVESIEKGQVREKHIRINY